MLPDDLEEELLEDLTEPLEDLELLVDLIVPDEDLELLADLTVPEDLLVFGLDILLLEDLDELLIVPFLDVRTAELDLPTLDPVALRDNLLEELFRLDKAEELLLARFR